MIADLKPYAEYKESGLPWLPRVPSHWDMRRSKYLFREVDQRSVAGTEMRLSMSQRHGLIPSSKIEERRLVSESNVGAKLCEPGDLVLNRLKAHLGVLALSPTRGLVSPDYTVFRSIGTANHHYFCAVYRSPYCGQELRQRAKGIVEGFWRLYTDDFYDIRVPLPPPNEQAAIVGFLDWANGRLERAIRAKRTVIALLNEQKQAIIHRAVTRGLDPSVHLKRSGISWLGDIPQHWEVHQLRRLVRPGRRITYGIVQPGEPDPNGRFMVRGQDYSTGWARADAIFRVSPVVETPYSRSRLSAGDLVVTIVGAGVGNVAIVPGWLDGANITQTTARVSVDPSKANPAYVALVLQGPIGKRNVERYVKGAAQPGLNLEHVRIFLLPSPPLSEQLRIVEATKRELDSFDRASSRLKREIELLREYRTRLVADVVTGKLDVREAAARLPDEPAPAIEEDDDLSIDSDSADEVSVV